MPGSPAAVKTLTLLSSPHKQGVLDMVLLLALLSCVWYPAGGGMVWVNNIAISAGATYTVLVGAGGAGPTSNPSSSDSAFYISTGAWRINARGGSPGRNSVGGAGGKWNVTGSGSGLSASNSALRGGGIGGRGGDQSWRDDLQADIAGGGGGAGGYTGG
jgi:hypothetical protein